MTKKEDIFSKLNIKDYNNKLEMILENKSYSEGTKNILLNILYKIETSYEDYSMVKKYVISKKELIEEFIHIIEKSCNEIEIIKPKIDGKTKLGNKKYIVQKGKIISYPNEKNVFYALNHLSEKHFTLKDNYVVINHAISKILNLGYIIDKEEVIRDFDGWTWNIAQKEIENYVSNIVYQNIKILLGEDFLKEAISNKQLIDFIKEFESKLDEVTLERRNDIKKIIYQVAVLEMLDERKKQVVFKIIDQLERELKQMENKRDFLHEVANSKKIIEENIKKTDELLNNNEILRQSFIKENSKLDEENKIFSLSEYIDIIQKRRNTLIKELKKHTEKMKPADFIKRKEKIKKEYEILKSINYDAGLEDEKYRLLINLQKSFLKAFNEKIKKVQLKKEIIEFVFLFRYYKLIYLNEEKQIKDIKELSKEIRETEKHVITKACKLKAMNILCQDIEENYKLVSKILSYNIIELNDVNLEFKKHEKNIVLTIYDEETIEDNIIYDGREKLNVKFNRKIKLFN